MADEVKENPNAEIDTVLLDGAAQLHHFTDIQRKGYLLQLRDMKALQMNAMREDMRIATQIGDESWQNRIRDIAKKEWKAIQAIDSEMKKIK